jgi:hypothetical protein
MKMSAADIAAYPKFYQYVKNDISALTSVAAIVNAIKKFSGSTTKAMIKQALQWRFGPTVKVVPRLVCGTVRAYGCYPWGSDIIQIDEVLVKAFEAGNDKRATISGAMVSVAGVTLLHELTHWADAKDGIDDPYLVIRPTKRVMPLKRKSTEK